MALADLPRARRIADKMADVYYRAHAYGMMALALAGTNPRTAQELLNHAFSLLQAQVESGKDYSNGFYNAAALAGCLVAVAEEIDPQLVPECFWRALSFRALPPEEDKRDYSNDVTDAMLALPLARYDRAVAGRLLETYRKRPGTVQGRTDIMLVAALQVDPPLAAEMLEKLPEGRERLYGRLKVAAGLLEPDADRWRKAYQSLGLWVTDNEDDY
jgi:uncharacterized protein YjeT (DUF2065 family)